MKILKIISSFEPNLISLNFDGSHLLKAILNNKYQQSHYFPQYFVSIKLERQSIKALPDMISLPMDIFLKNLKS